MRRSRHYVPVTRRAFVGTLAATMLGASLRPGEAQPAGEADPGPRLSLLLQEFDRQGTHRTGSRGDLVSGQWLTTELQRWRVSATLEPFTFPRTDITNAYLQLRERRIDGLPLFDAPFTDDLGVVGRLGTAEANTEIVVVESTSPAWPPLRRTTKSGGIVLLTIGARPGLRAADAPDYASPVGVPVLQVSSEEAAALRDEAAKGSGVRLVVDAKRVPGEAVNLVARIRGRDASAPPLVVCASRSAWWRATSERGGALVCLLDVGRALSFARPLRDCVLLATSGGEIGGPGLQAAIAKHPEWLEAHAWLCLGPNLGAKERSARVLQATDAALATLVREAAAAADVTLQDVPADEPLGGDAQRLPASVKRVQLAASGNPHRGLASDRWPEAVAASALAAEAGIAVQVARKLALS